ncbi:GRAM domain-containing protein 2B-like isoform X2 [Limulus polyphemus]|uniref:GRAM domain-containing protein 2B-like isoform X2 n=1 Tax=Limulus polyphemus TaxID=6850 RepID=A0ABM1TRU8_LIMPO|nr:GRAM domain-containing protein 2B-like isoform X2 [Limulus polyphemus]
MPSVVHPSSHTEDDIELPTPSKFGLVRLHESRFHHHFPAVSSEEHLINYYHCALVSDILLQGFLYLSKNYFAFYSNIFGYKTKFLIPVGSVTKITKERVAKIIPNAIGITTHDEKYVFGSLLSRDASYRLIYKIWKKASCEREMEDESFTSSSSDQTTTDDASSLSTKIKKEHVRKSPSSRSSSPPWHNLKSTSSKTGTVSPKCQPSNSVVWSITKDCFGKVEETFVSICKLPRTSVLLAVSSVLLVLLFFSATFLMYRISVVHRRMTNGEHLQPFSKLKQKQNKLGQTKIVTEEVIQLTDNLQNRINQLVMVRKSLAELMDVTIQDKNSCNTQKEKVADTAPGQWVAVGT